MMFPTMRMTEKQFLLNGAPWPKLKHARSQSSEKEDSKHASSGMVCLDLICFGRRSFVFESTDNQPR